MMTEAELTKISKRKMAHHRLVFYETPNGKIQILSHKKRKGYVPLRVAGEEIEMTINHVNEDRMLIHCLKVAHAADAKSEEIYPNLDEIYL